MSRARARLLLPALALLSCATGGRGGGGGDDGAIEDPGPRPAGILRVSGRQLVDDEGRPVTLRGVAFGNAVWSNVELPTGHHAEIDYQRVQDMGMNLVRFYLNYRTFEDDSAPGVYKESGFRWIDQNVEWARRHGIRLMLNMHVPQGGFQSLSRGTALWTDVRNQDRLTALWKEIARRYRDEPAIAGYDLVNEPVVAGEKDQWVRLANRIVRAIRQVDPWHIITVERLNGRRADGTGNADWSSDADLNFFTVDDPNVLYEFHVYTPFEFTHQLASWVTCCQVPTTYPDPSALSVSWSTLTWKHWSWDGTPAAGALRVPDGDSPWTAYSVRFTVTDPTWNVGRPVFMSQQNAGTVYFDDFEVNEYDPEGRLVRQVFQVDVEDPSAWSLWKATPGAPGDRVAGRDGHAGARSVGIAGTTTDASLSADVYFFKVQPGYTYELKYWARAEGSRPGSTSLGRLDFLTSSAPLVGREKALLAAELDRFAGWGEAHGVPLYLGEFGAIRAAFDRGGTQWVADMLDLLATRDIAWTYHSYHESAFGIYWGDYPSPPDPSNANTALIELFREKLRP